MTANVRDIDAVREFRVKLMRFAEELEGTLQSLQMEMQRAFEWADQDRPHYWANQVRRAHDEVAATRVAYETCRLRTVAGHRSACLEEKMAFDKARRRLDYCQQQVEQVRKWSMKIHHQADEFRGRMVSLRRLLDADIPRALAALNQTVRVLEQYAEIQRPVLPMDEGSPGE